MNIDFYILDTTSNQQSLVFTCRLLEKLYQEKGFIYVHADSHELAQRLDDMLWTYRDDSFLPHALYDPSDAESLPIRIGFKEISSDSFSNMNLLVNLASEIPSFYNQFQQVIEIVFSDPTVQQLARVRYKQYRDQGHDINTIKLKASEL